VRRALHLHARQQSPPDSQEPQHTRQRPVRGEAGHKLSGASALAEGEVPPAEGGRRVCGQSGH